MKRLFHLRKKAPSNSAAEVTFVLEATFSVADGITETGPATIMPPKVYTVHNGDTIALDVVLDLSEPGVR